MNKFFKFLSIFFYLRVLRQKIYLIVNGIIPVNPMFNYLFSSQYFIYQRKNLGKTVITKKQMIDFGYEDVRSLLENVVGLDIYSDGPRGQKSSVFLRGTNSNHTLVLMNGIPINDQSSPKAMFDFGYDFLQGLQQIEIYKGASGAIFGPAAIGGAINFITDIDYQNSFIFNRF